MSDKFKTVTSDCAYLPPVEQRSNESAKAAEQPDTKGSVVFNKAAILDNGRDISLDPAHKLYHQPDEATSKEQFEKFLAVYDQHVKQYNTQGVTNQWSGEWCYTYADTGALFTAFKAGQRCTPKRESGWVTLDKAPLHKVGMLIAPKLDYPVRGQVHDGGPEGRFGSSGEARGMDFTHWCEFPEKPRRGSDE